VIVAAGHGWGLAIFPLLAAVIALVFAAVLARRVVDRWRPHEAVWVVALLMYAVASGAMFIGVRGGWTPSPFRLYWLFGAVLNVPFLLAGEVYLLARGRVVAHGFLIGLVILSVVAAISVFTATVHRGPLGGSLPLGKDVFGDGSLPYRLAQYYSLPAYFLLLGGLVWSALQMRGNPSLRDRTVGTFGIAAGATIVAVGSGIGAAFHVVPLFSVGLAVGIGVMFWGFLRVSHRTSPRPAPIP
jgi:hypothetical protein